MNQQQLVDVMLRFFYIILEISLPILCGALVIGLVISVFQAATQINESTLSFFPKMLVVVGLLVFLSSWIIQKIHDYTVQTYEQIPNVLQNKVIDAFPKEKK